MVKGKCSSIRLLKFTADKATCMRHNGLRKGDYPENLSKSVPDVVIHTFFKNAEQITESGYDETIEVPVIDYPELKKIELMKLRKKADANIARK